MAGIYLHVPFCVKKCDYCDFISFPEKGMAKEYFASLWREIELCSKENRDREFNTVFFGGGTPSMLPPYYITQTMQCVRDSFNLTIDEATIECNPGTLDEEKLTAYKKAGFNRISIGVQSFDDRLLRSIGRIHTASEAEEAVSLARAAGFDNINIDLMYGLPNQTEEDYITSIERAAGLGVEHISAYSLILEEGTRLYDRVKSGEIYLPDEDAVYDMHRAGMERLSELGYTRYEISNYSKPGKQSLHNLNYWNVGEYLGIGLNSSSALMEDGRLVRFRNADSISEYIDEISKGVLPRRETERVSVEEEMFEWAMLGLRKIEGVDREAFMQRFCAEFADVFAQAVDTLEKMGWLERDERCIRLTDRGLDMQNSALMEFMDAK
ncbi:MAG: radical SAM family heme chaperone HemW [Clostridia bacterium]|nr:radical SAM family heme chaperone HemW [Clostridia bacterium]